MGEFLIHEESYYVNRAAMMRTKDNVLSTLEEKWDIN